MRVHALWLLLHFWPKHSLSLDEAAAKADTWISTSGRITPPVKEPDVQPILLPSCSLRSAGLHRAASVIGKIKRAFVQRRECGALPRREIWLGKSGRYTRDREALIKLTNCLPSLLVRNKRWRFGGIILYYISGELVDNWMLDISVHMEWRYVGSIEESSMKLDRQIKSDS